MLITLAFLALAGTSNANFLSKNVTKMRLKALSEASIEERFLQEVRGLTGKGPADLQLPAIKAALEPMWLGLPKNQHGGLDQGQVKYALHRLFVQRHGWHIDGLNAGSNGTVSAAGIIREKVPAFLMELFEEAFGATGLKLDEIAVFAATLERLIHDETIDRLKDVYLALDMSTSSMQSEADADFIMQAFMMSLVLGLDKVKESDINKVTEQLKFLERSYPAWDEAKAWLKSTLQTTVSALEPTTATDGFSFEQMERATEEAAMTFGKFLDRSCMDIKNAILESEEKGSGRVLLSNFYKKGAEKGMLFREKPDYLRQLGALDESQKGEPRMIVANYMTSPTNCLIETGFYNVCCLNECESVMGQLEKAIGAPQATPDRIIEVISSITTSTVEVPKQLEDKMVEKLRSAAERNGGQVPLYGRLFAQWLHFAFPRECPFPHTAGAINPVTGADYFKQTQEKSSMRKDEMNDLIEKLAAGEQAQESEDESEDDILRRWSDEEEILFLPTEAPRTVLGSMLRLVLALAMLGCVGFAGVEAASRFGGMDVGVNTKAWQPEKAHIL